MSFITTIQPIHDLFIGRCLFDHEKFTRIEPLLVETSDGWQSLPNRQHLFPPSGNVFSYERSAQNCPEGTLRFFKVQLNTRPRTDDAHDHYIAIDVQEPIEVVDLRHLGNCEVIRRSIVEDGVSLARPATSEVLFIIENNACVQLRLAQDAITRRWSPLDLGALDNLQILALTKTDESGPIVNGRHFIAPGRRDTVMLRRVDWSPDSIFLRTVLRALQRKSAFQVGGQMQDVGQRVVRQLALELRSDGALSGDPSAEVLIRERLADFLPGLDQKLDAAQSLADELMKSPSVLAAIEAHRDLAKREVEDELRNELEPLLRAQIDDAFTARKLEKNFLDSEAAVASARVDELKIEIKNLEETLESHHSALDGELGKILKPISDIARLANRSVSTSPEISAKPPWSAPSRQHSKAIGIAELAGFLKTTARQTALSESRLLEFDALLRCGEIPLLFGSHAEKLLQVYSETVCGGTLWRFPVDATTIGLDDLWRQGISGVPTGFANAWLAALQAPDVPAFVVLDDIDAAVVGRWLPRLTSMLSSALRPPNFFVAATLSGTRTRTIPPFEILAAAFPFQIESTPAAIASVVKEETLPSLPASPTHLMAPFNSAVNADLSTQLATLFLQENTSFNAARRGARVFKTAIGTMRLSEAQALAVEVAQLISSPAHAKQGLSPNCKSFAALEAQANSAEFN